MATVSNGISYWHALGPAQRLTQLQNTFTNAAGAHFALAVNAQTNGVLFVPQLYCNNECK